MVWYSIKLFCIGVPVSAIRRNVLTFIRYSAFALFAFFIYGAGWSGVWGLGHIGTLLATQPNSSYNTHTKSQLPDAPHQELSDLVLGPAMCIAPPKSHWRGGGGLMSEWNYKVSVIDE